MILSTETVKSLALSLQCIDNIKSSDSLSFGVFSVCDCVSDDILKEYLQDTTSLFVNQTRNTFDTTTTSKTTNGGFSDTLDIITENLAMTLGTSLSKTFSSFTTS